MAESPDGNCLPELREFVVVGSTTVAWRFQQLKLLREVLQEEKDAMVQALASDLCVDEAQATAFQMSFLLGELDVSLKNLSRWAAPQKVSTPMILQPASSYVMAQPKGVVLVLGAWNYPYVVTIGPVISALAAGNCVVIKPSELAPESAKAMGNVFSRLDPRAVRCCLGGVELSKSLISQPFDHIVYTGSARVGKLVLAAAAPNLTPVTLELGGKSPVVICSGINIQEACRRVLFWKFLNTGQTCISPDYILVEQKVRDEVIETLKKVAKEWLGDGAEAAGKLSRMVSQQAAERMQKMLQEPHGGQVVLGGSSPADGKVTEAQRYVQPTIVVDPKDDSTLIQEEIFGPLLPVVTVASSDEAIAYINAKPKPLALYVFAPGRVVDTIMQRTSSGGFLAGDCTAHKGNAHLPFGGIGGSGMGSLHGIFGFKELSHQRAVMYRPLFPPSPFKIPTDGTLSKAMWFLATLKPWALRCCCFSS